MHRLILAVAYVIAASLSVGLLYWSGVELPVAVLGTVGFILAMASIHRIRTQTSGNGHHG